MNDAARPDGLPIAFLGDPNSAHLRRRAVTSARRGNRISLLVEGENGVRQVFAALLGAAEFALWLAHSRVEPPPVRPAQIRGEAA